MKIVITNEEKQILLDLLPLIDADLKEKEETIRSFKWLCDVAQTGKGYEENKNVYTLQDNAIRKLKELHEQRKQLILKFVNSTQQ